jgi:hypothetical protein
VDWGVDKIDADLDPVLQEFEKRFILNTVQDSGPSVPLLRTVKNSMLQ